MSERTILITGCSTGIGRTSALGMKARGWRVFATARRPEDIAALERDGLEALYLDYTQPASIATCADTVLARTGGHLFALFNNGAYGQAGAMEDIATDVLRAQFEANVFGWHDLTGRLLPPMIDRGAGRIVQNSSLLGLVAMKYRGPYTASKFAIEALSDTLRLEMRGSGVFVSLIEPGPVRSKFSETAVRNLARTIDIGASRHADRYRARIDAVERGEDPDARNARFRLEPEAVLEKLIDAVESPNPKPHYYVTLPTHFMAAARRLLPNRLLDRLLAAIG
jgi:NAD(P)-dependent dehydrogenase (short-subunit alcohol dehydrogenase family)